MSAIKTPRLFIIPVVFYILLTIVIIISSLSFFSMNRETALRHEIETMISGMESLLAKFNSQELGSNQVLFTSDTYEVRILESEELHSATSFLPEESLETFLNTNQVSLYVPGNEDEFIEITYLKKTSLDGRIFLLRTSITDLPSTNPTSLMIILIASIGLILLSIISGIWYLKRFVIPLNKFSIELEEIAAGNRTKSSFSWLPSELQILKTQAKKISSSWQLISKERAVKERDLSSVVEAINDGIIILDKSNKISLINTAVFELYGVEATNWKNSSIIETLRNSDLDDFCRTVAEMQAHYRTTLEIFQENEIKTVIADAAPLHNQRNKYDGSVVLLHDISRLTQLEKLRKDFVANVSHEIKTPVTSIKGFIENIIDEEWDDRPHIQEFLTIVLRQTNRLEQIIEDLLSLSRVEQLNESIELSEVEMDSFLEEIKNIIEAGEEAQKTSINYVLKGNSKGYFNPNLMLQAILNLMQNAIKYGHEGGTTELIIDIQDAVQTFSVSDNGQGISSRELHRLFERFYRVDKARSRQLGGTGLGLSIVKHIAQSHGGKVEVDSILGEGSTFVITIPMPSL